VTPALPQAQVSANVVGASISAPLGRLPREVRGRDSLLRRLHDRLNHGGLVVLTGPGGVGKSTIAAELVRQIQDRTRFAGEHCDVWWVSGANASSLNAGLVSVARRLGGTAADLQAISAQAADGPDRLWHRLEQALGDWLLVIDNADDPRLLAAPAVPAREGERTSTSRVSEGTGWARSIQRGLVLVTSRQRTQAVWGTQAIIELVGTLPDSEAGQVLLDLAPGAGDREQAEALSRRLGGLPLALRLAGSYLSSEFARWTTFDAYRQGLEREPSVALTDPEPEEDEREALMRTWELSLDDLTRHHLGQARALLRLLSCYAPSRPIPLDLLEPAKLSHLLEALESHGEVAARRLEQGLRGLSSLGLIDSSIGDGADRATIVVHPVIADNNRARLISPDPSDPDPGLIRSTAVALMGGAIHVLDPRQPADWMRFRLLTPHLQALLTYTADHLDKEPLAALADAANQLSEAQEWSGGMAVAEALSRAVLACVRRLGDDHPIVLSTRHALAYEIGRQGRWGEAEAAFHEILEARRRVLGDDHPSTLNTRHELARTVAEQGRGEQAAAAFREVLEDRRRILSEDDPSTLNTRQELARTVARQGHWALAELAFRELLEDRRRTLGDDHPSTLATRHELARTVAEQGHWDQAAVALRVLVEDQRPILGERHPSTLNTRYELARVLAGQGHREEAEAAFRVLLEDLRRVLGEDHPDVHATQRWLGLTDDLDNQE
jgi:tetratricopeptide (TPR) repeat protein